MAVSGAFSLFADYQPASEGDDFAPPPLRFPLKHGDALTLPDDVQLMLPRGARGKRLKPRPLFYFGGIVVIAPSSRRLALVRADAGGARAAAIEPFGLQSR